MKMGARSRYANRADVSVSVAIPQRGVTGISRLSLALVGVPGDPLTITLTLAKGMEMCACPLADSATYTPSHSPKPFQRSIILFSRELS